MALHDVACFFPQPSLLLLKDIEAAWHYIATFWNKKRYSISSIILGIKSQLSWDKKK